MNPKHQAPNTKCRRTYGCLHPDQFENRIASGHQTTNNKHQTGILYSTITLARKYIHYWLTASNGKGHGVHSPFVFDFISKLLNDKTDIPSSEAIEAVRRNLLCNRQRIDVIDFGAGSAVISTNRRKVCDIAASSLKKPRYAKLLHRLAKYYSCNNIIELGTSFGTTSAYLATASPEVSLHTFEGAPAIADIAQTNFNTLRLSNIQLHLGDFKSTLSAYLSSHPTIDLAYVDGHHQKEPTLQYFHWLLSSIHEDSILIFDDIHWSKEMEEAWEEIKSNGAITLSIDLFFIGIVFVKKEFKEQQHFTIRF